MEELGQKINNGMIEEIIALNLDPKILEQAQLVSELIANGELNRVPERCSTFLQILNSDTFLNSYDA